MRAVSMAARLDAVRSNWSYIALRSRSPCARVMREEDSEVRTGRLSSLPLQVVVYFSGWYLVLFYPSLLAALLYKGLLSAASCAYRRAGCAVEPFTTGACGTELS